MRNIQRVVTIVKNFNDADQADIQQQLNMTSEERQDIAKQLKKRYYGDKTIDLREWYKNR